MSQRKSHRWVGKPHFVWSYSVFSIMQAVLSPLIFDNVKCNLKCILARIAILNYPWLCVSKIPTGFVCGWEAGRGIVSCHCNRSWWAHGSLTQDTSVYYVGKGHKGKGNWASWNPEEVGRIVKKKGFQFILINISEGWLFGGGRERTFRRSLIKDIHLFTCELKWRFITLPRGFSRDPIYCFKDNAAGPAVPVICQKQGLSGGRIPCWQDW